MDEKVSCQVLEKLLEAKMSAHKTMYAK